MGLISQIRWRAVPPCAMTLAAMLTGVAAIIFGLQDDLKTAATLVFAAMLLDGMDGALARLLKGTSAFGMELDSFSDAMALGAAPALLVYKLATRADMPDGMPGWMPVAGVLLCAMIATAGVCRLARFRLTNDPHHDKGAYQGLAIGGPAGWVALFTFCHAAGVAYRLPGGAAVPFSIYEGPFAILFWCVLVLLPFLEISTIPYPKPTKNAFNFALFALCLACTVAWPLARPATALVLLAYGIWYALCAPVVRHIQHRHPRPAT
ncbi:MAG: CDP-alcohol phosphatidyltransferase family protein [Kiritimatiellaeota bacterium]|nr:CDP-alcohol phosphatidyltransferase family protein [Kiritimatiellota bacterium]